MGCCCGTKDVANEGEDRRLVQDQDEPVDDGRDVEAGLEDHNVVNEQLPPIYYVIVGRGPMAVVNHRTLLTSLWGQARLGDLDVLHVGAPNPWPRYLQHGLGQPNHLLSLPAFVNQPSVGGNAIDGGLDSQHFGGQVNAEFATLNAEVAAEWVALIQSRAGAAAQLIDARIAAEAGGDTVRDAVNPEIQKPWPAFAEGDAPYRLCLYDPVEETARLVYAAKIDICTGPGRPSVFAPANGDSAETRAARTPPWICPEIWTDALRDRRTLNGVDAIRDEVVWNNGERVCVTAGGGVGLNAAEKARNRQCVLDWFGRTELMPIFENPRNITYLREPNTENHRAPARRLDVGINGEDDLIASSKRARMGRGANLAAVADTAVAVEVRLVAAGNANIIRDWWGNQSPLNAGEGRWELSQDYTDGVGVPVAESRVYRRLVIPNGQATNQVGHPHSFAHHLGFHAVEEEAGRMVALETGDRLVRVLGAACNNYPGYAFGTWEDGGDTPKDRMWNFHATLPVSAVIDGFIICGINTAMANHYFTAENPNMNVNTMTLAELTAVVGDVLAAAIIAGRHDNNGYLNLVQLRAACNNSQDVRLALLQFAYP